MEKIHWIFAYSMSGGSDGTAVCGRVLKPPMRWVASEGAAKQHPKNNLCPDCFDWSEADFRLSHTNK